MNDPQPVKHKWLLREEDDRYECANCGKIVGKRTLNAVRSAMNVHGNKIAASLIYCSKKSGDVSNQIKWAEIVKLFNDKRVVAFEELEPFMSDDPETFWEGDEGQAGMFSYLERKGFELVQCRDKGTDLLSEIYVKFDKFEDQKEPVESNRKVDMSLSEPAKSMREIDIIKKISLDLAKATQRGFVEISQYADGFKVFFSRKIKINDDLDLKKQRVLRQLSEELNIEFVA